MIFWVKFYSENKFMELKVNITLIQIPRKSLSEMCGKVTDFNFTKLCLYMKAGSGVVEISCTDMIYQMK